MSDVVARTHNLTKRFGGRAVLDGVSVTARAGEVIGVLGKNGAGKTTLLEVLLGFSPPSDGSSDVFGCDSVRLPAAVKARIGFVPQRDELVDLMTGAQQLDVAACLHPGWNRVLIDRLARDWHVPRGERIWTLSAGERQKLSILLALGHEPDLLVFDEPVASLDPVARRDFLQQLWDLAAAGSKTIVFSSHIVSDLERAASTVWILKDGRIAWAGPLDALKESVVRLHIRASHPLDRTVLDIPHALSARIEGQHAVIVVSDWTSVAQDVTQQLDAHVEVEPLALEEIFLEFHR
jgi:ABC-2 type transport system ATP-binding protein